MGWVGGWWWWRRRRLTPRERAKTSERFRGRLALLSHGRESGERGARVSGTVYRNTSPNQAVEASRLRCCVASEKFGGNAMYDIISYPLVELTAAAAVAGTTSRMVLSVRSPSLDHENSFNASSTFEVSRSNSRRHEHVYVRKEHLKSLCVCVVVALKIIPESPPSTSKSPSCNSIRPCCSDRHGQFPRPQGNISYR